VYTPRVPVVVVIEVDIRVIYTRHAWHAWYDKRSMYLPSICGIVRLGLEVYIYPACPW
jgi:hypothetical protein